MKIHVEVFRVLTPCSVIVGYQHYGGRWRQRGHPKRWYPTATVHSVTTQNTSRPRFNPILRDDVSIAQLLDSYNLCMRCVA